MAFIKKKPAPSEPEAKAAAPSYKRSGFDRRVDEDRRTTFDLDYLEGQKKERRSGKQRRRQPETRKGWVRVSSWTSVLSHFDDRVSPEPQDAEPVYPPSRY